MFLKKCLFVLLEIFLKNPFLKKVMPIRLIDYQKKTKQYNNRIPSSAIIKPMQAALKRNEGYAYRNLIDKNKEKKRKYKNHGLLRTADMRKT